MLQYLLQNTSILKQKDETQLLNQTVAHF